MTRKDYIKAVSIVLLAPKKNRPMLRDAFINFFHGNANFDESRFYLACSVDS